MNSVRQQQLSSRPRDVGLCFHHLGLQSSESFKICAIMCFLADKTLERCSGWRNAVGAAEEINVFTFKGSILHFLSLRKFGRSSLPNSAARKKATLHELLKSVHCDSQLWLHHSGQTSDFSHSEPQVWLFSTNFVFCFLCSKQSSLSVKYSVARI